MVREAVARIHHPKYIQTTIGTAFGFWLAIILYQGLRLSFISQTSDLAGVMDPLLQWPFVSLVVGLLFTAHLLLQRWALRRGSESDVKSFQRWKRRSAEPLWWMYLALPIYMLHQFEEHGYDLKGRRYEFQVFICRSLVSGIGILVHLVVNLTPSLFCRDSPTFRAVLPRHW